MENKEKNIFQKSKATRFAFQKTIHLFIREMLRYYDIYLLLGVLCTKTLYLYLANEKLSVPNFIVGIIAAFEFFLIFARVGMEYQRKKNMQNIYAEMLSVQFYIRISFVIIMVICGFWVEFSMLQLGQIIFSVGCFVASNQLLKAAAVTIHSKDVEFVEKLSGYKRAIEIYEPKALANAAQSEIIAEAKVQKYDFAGKSWSESQLKKKFQNLLFNHSEASKEKNKRKMEKILSQMLDLKILAKRENLEIYKYMSEKLNEFDEM
jgi:hypothetical protein